MEERTKKSLGQHWLKDQPTLQTIVKAADIKSGDVVLEIGAGLGTLTDQLLAAGAEVLALEVDHELYQQLNKKYQDRSSAEIFIQPDDIRNYDLDNMPDTYKIVANIPYYLTANLLRKLVDDDHKPQIAALLMQKEVAERVANQPGQMSFISAAVQLFYKAELGPEVPAELFTPPPKVDSQVLILTKLLEFKYPDIDPMALIKFIKVGFSQPRKTLINNFTGGLQLDRPAVEAMLHKAGLKPTARAQELTLDQWHDLYLAK